MSHFNTTTHPEAIVYARVSSKEQEKEGYSIPAQLKLLRDYAQTKGLVVTNEFVDVETAKQAGRTGFGEMFSSFRSKATGWGVEDSKHDL